MRRIVWILLVLVLVACQQEDPPALPTSAASDTPAASTTPLTPSATIIQATLPPTWTPGALPNSAGANPVALVTSTPLPERTLPPGAPTLPPTWTPAPVVQNPGGPSSNFNYEAGQTAQAITPTLTPTEVPVDDICFVFAPDEPANRITESIFSGQGVTVFWKPIPLPGYTYEFKLYHQDGVLVLTQTTPDYFFVIPEGVLISQNATYGWEAQPLLNGRLTCFPITGEIYVQAVGE